jgi:hypothetical protein
VLFLARNILLGKQPSLKHFFRFCFDRAWALFLQVPLKSRAG